ncbi:unnamed protein product [Moneuplotes crassus]|uniref:Citrate synthase n=1 Tax=Euplotes crassus TaxID=5936 RepID=A0AAD1UGH7_EUPCR|nr:unnamed protein product [Moneuplotes crassus]
MEKITKGRRMSEDFLDDEKLLQATEVQSLGNFIKRFTINPKHKRKNSMESGMYISKEAVDKRNKKLAPKVPESKEKCKLVLPDGTEVELSILEGTLGPKMIDVRDLYAKTGMFTFDPGYTASGSCVSAITYIDGGKGQLLYRGYKIEDLAANCTFIESCFLLLYGELPTAAELSDFEERVKDEMLVHEKLKDFFKGFNPKAHPMAIMCSVIGALSSFYHEDLDIEDPKQRERVAIQLIAKFPTLAAFSFRTSMGLPMVYPRRDLSYIENFLHMMFSDPMDTEAVIEPVMTEALDKILLLHADHEQNASTSTVRIAGSSKANPFACISAGIASLWGPAHGGANQACIEMLQEIGETENIPKYIEKAKDKNDPFRIMGFGHRVYKNFDPRATVMAKMCKKVVETMDTRNQEMLSIALELEKIALEDEYFIKRKLYPNVDFYSGIVLQELSIPTNMFTVIFALARTIGWVCQWKEMMSEDVLKIGRPRQLYVGETCREFVSIHDR